MQKQIFLFEQVGETSGRWTSVQRLFPEDDFCHRGICNFEFFGWRRGPDMFWKKGSLG